MRIQVPLSLITAVAISSCARPATMQQTSFVDRAVESGLKFTHVNGMSGHFYFPEMMGPGVALFDYDNDGDLDVFLVQGQMLGSGTPLIPASANGSSEAGTPPLGDRLY